MDGSILAVFQHCDAMITDVSSVGLDFLYLQTERPLFLTDRRSDPAQLTVDAPISAACDVIDSSTIDSFGQIVGGRLEADALLSRRRELRRYYFGDLAPGESTRQFLAAVSDAVAQRDDLLARLPHHQLHAAGAAAATGDMGTEEDETRFQSDDAVSAGDEALTAAQDALAAAKGAVAHAKGAVAHAKGTVAQAGDTTAQPSRPRTQRTGAPAIAPSPGGFQIR
jgi:hypothetical protein